MIAPLLASLAVAVVAPPSRAPSMQDCIQLSSGSDTHYFPANDRTIAIQDQGRRWYKLTVSPSSMLNDPTAFFINDIRGTSTLCSPLDFDLSVASTPPGGFREHLIVQAFEPITAAEGEALRKQSRR